MEAKPICVIYFPDAFNPAGSRDWIYDYMRFLNGGTDGNDKFRYHKRDDYYKDYYWFCFYGDDIREPRFEVFNTKDFTPAQFDEIKSMINEVIQSQLKPKDNDTK